VYRPATHRTPSPNVLEKKCKSEAVCWTVAQEDLKIMFEYLIVLSVFSGFRSWRNSSAVPVLLCVVSALYIFSAFCQCLAFQCLWYPPLLCVTYLICPTFFVVFILSDNFSNVNFLLPICLLNSSFQFFRSMLSLSLNTENYYKF